MSLATHVGLPSALLRFGFTRVVRKVDMKSHNNAAVSDLETRAVQLLESLKGIASARVQVDARERITHVYVQPIGIDERQAARNAQSAIYAVLGQSLDINCFSASEEAAFSVRASEPNVVEFAGAAHRSELHEAARVAFDTLRAAQSGFHGYQFDGAELVKINGTQYVVVALKRSGGSERYSGAAPVVNGVGSASARALMNAVSVAAMTGSLELNETKRSVGNA